MWSLRRDCRQHHPTGEDYKLTAPNICTTFYFSIANLTVASFQLLANLFSHVSSAGKDELFTSVSFLQVWPRPQPLCHKSHSTLCGAGNILCSVVSFFQMALPWISWAPADRHWSSWHTRSLAGQSKPVDIIQVLFNTRQMWLVCLFVPQSCGRFVWIVCELTWRCLHCV